MKKSNLIAGFALFTMFFGAGNMILPLLLMQKNNDTWLSASIGFILSAVLVTFLGLCSSIVTGGVKNFFAPLGTKLSLIVQLVIICIEGPFGIVPRCMIVSFGAIESTLGKLPNVMFYIFSYVIMYYMALNKKRIINVIGKFLTPVMLICLLAVCASTFYTRPFELVLAQDISMNVLYEGLKIGYLTYDLPGAIYFASIALVYLIGEAETKREKVVNGLKVSLLSVGMLLLVYAVFFYLGLAYHDDIAFIAPEMILPTIIKSTMGKASHVIFTLFIYLACLTTAVAAISIWTDFILEYLPSKIKKDINTRKGVLAISLGVALIVSMNNFTGLIAILMPILSFIYPILICLSIYNIYKYRKTS
jgi:LIVCS family branched-chain amino acid:cation transporter